MQTILKHKIHILVVLVLIGVGYFVFKSSSNKISDDVPQIAYTYKCPSDYTDKNKYNSDLKAFVTEYIAKHPNATQDEMMVERDNLFIEHKCIAEKLANLETNNWCPESEQEMIATLEYMRGLEVAEVLGIMKSLSHNKCLNALEKINAMMANEIKSGTSPGSNF